MLQYSHSNGASLIFIILSVLLLFLLYVPTNIRRVLIILFVVGVYFLCGVTKMNMFLNTLPFAEFAEILPIPVVCLVALLLLSDVVVMRQPLMKRAMELE